MLFIICIICIFITLYLLDCSKTNDKYLLLFSLMGQSLLVCGYIYENNYIIEISHILFWLLVLFGTFFCKETYNIQFILLCIIITLTTRLYYNDCLFLIKNNNTTLVNYTDININKMCVFLIMILLYRLVNQSHQ